MGGGVGEDTLAFRVRFKGVRTRRRACVCVCVRERERAGEYIS